MIARIREHWLVATILLVLALLSGIEGFLSLLERLGLSIPTLGIPEGLGAILGFLYDVLRVAALPAVLFLLHVIYTRLQARTSESRRLRAAVDVVTTWLYRRSNGGLTSDALLREPAPTAWGRDAYAALGIGDLTYSPPPVVPPEPGGGAFMEQPPVPMPEEHTYDQLVDPAQIDLFAFPPVIDGVPTNQRDTQIQAWAREIDKLVQDGEKFISAIWEPAPRQIDNAHEKNRWTSRAETWMGQVVRHGRDWFGEDPPSAASEPPYSELEVPAAPQPRWRAILAARVQRDLDWLLQRAPRG